MFSTVLKAAFEVLVDFTSDVPVVVSSLHYVHRTSVLLAIIDPDSLESTAEAHPRIFMFFNVNFPAFSSNNVPQGKDAIPFLESLVVGDIAGLKDGTGTLSVFTNEKGGIIDDTVVTRVTPSHIYIVVNAGCRDKDLGELREGNHSSRNECATCPYAAVILTI